MRKKFLAMYALVGALVASPIFTSCIDSEESASVTQVRSERAAQIKAAAEMQKAMDELNLQLKQIELEGNKAELEKTKAEAEKAVLAAQLEILKNQASLDDYNNTRLSTLAKTYTDALSAILGLNKQLYNANVELTSLQEGLVTAQEFVASETARLNAEIAAKKAALETLSKAEGIDKEAIVAQLNDLYTQLDVVKAEKVKLGVEFGSLDVFENNNTLHDQYAQIHRTDGNGNPLYYKKDINGNVTNEYTTNATVSYEIPVSTPVAQDDETGGTGEDGDAGENGGADEDTPTTETVKYENVPVYEDGERTQQGLYGQYYENPAELATIKAARQLHLLAVGMNNDDASGNYDFLTRDENGYLILLQEAVVRYQQNNTYDPKEDLEKAVAALGKEADEATTTVSKDSEELTAYAKLAAANKKMTDAKAMKEETDAEKEAKKTAIAEAELAVAAANDYINVCKVAIANETKELETYEGFDTYVAAFSGANYDAYKAAKDAVDEKNVLEETLNTEIRTIRDIYIQYATTGSDSYGYDYVFKSDFNFDEEVAKLENEIKQNEAALENIKTQLGIDGDWEADINGGEYTEAEIEALIAWKKEAIANLEIQLEVKQAEADNAKAALDAYLATEEEA